MTLRLRLALFNPAALWVASHFDGSGQLGQALPHEGLGRRPMHAMPQVQARLDLRLEGMGALYGVRVESSGSRSEFKRGDEDVMRMV